MRFKWFDKLLNQVYLCQLIEVSLHRSSATQHIPAELADIDSESGVDIIVYLDVS